MQNDDEWLSNDDEKKDYSGLKIGTLKIEDEDPKPEEEHEINEEGERVLIKKSEGGVWSQKRKDQNNSSPGMYEANQTTTNRHRSHPDPFRNRPSARRRLPEPGE